MSAEISSDDSPRYAVVGGGISGLTAAYRISRLVPQATVELFEAGDRLGGVLDTRTHKGCLIERGADSFFTKYPWAAELCHELGLEDDLLPTNVESRRALVVRSGKLHPVPEGFVVMRPQRIWPLVRTPLLSWLGKLRLFCEPWIASPNELAQNDFDESVASFATRRLGRETFEQLVQPLLAGIYTADPYQLSLAATMPEALAAEREFGSLRRAMKSGALASENASGARYSGFVTPRNGLKQLVDALADQLTEQQIHRNCLVDRITQTEGKQWSLFAANEKSLGTFRGVIVAVPTPCAATIVEGVDSQLGDLLRKIPYASSAVVSLVFRREQISHPLDGFGFVVPTVENRAIVAASFSSNKFPGRAPDETVLIRVFLGGALNPEQVDFSEDKLQEIALTELRRLVGLRGEPLIVDIAKWHEKMPQYHVGHVQLIEGIESRVEKLPGLELAGNAYHGVGIPQCVHSGEQAAKRVIGQRL